MRVRLRMLVCWQSACLACVAVSAAGDDVETGVDETESVVGSPSFKDKLIGLLPEPVSGGLEIETWGWFAYMRNNQDRDSETWDIELSLAITKTFDQRVTISAQGDFIDANGETRVELGQGYLSALLFEETQSILTVGKFNANFGVEGRDFWNRTTGTTSLLFGAQPQDIVGLMLTQPIGDSGWRLRPFLTADFQGGYDFDQPPAGGLVIEDRPNEDWRFALTNLVGPGFVLYGGRPLEEPYPRGAYGADPAAVISNWQGPNFVAERDGTLQFHEIKVEWQAQPDLKFSAECLLGITQASTGRWGWQGWMAQADYDVTDRLHLFGRFSYLDDADWLVTGNFMTAREASCGFGYELIDNVELRGEYRHDFNNISSDIDSLSIHLTFTY